MSGLRELVTSAFGINACLYKDVLQCSSKATPSGLRKAYHKRALRYHPDKYRISEAPAIDKNKSGTGGQRSKASEDDRLKEATTKFQALSATYQLLSNPFQRANYDSNGRIPTGIDEDVRDRGTSATSGEFNGKAKSQRNDEWVRFFRSVVHDMMHAGMDCDRKEYCGSEQEQEDVLHNYQLCKGDRSKMMSCIVQSEQQDLERWWKDIIQPAIEEGDVENFEGISHDVQQLETESASTNINKTKRRKRLVRKKRGTLTKMHRQKEEVEPDLAKSSTIATRGLEDTDEEDEISKTTSSIQQSRAMNRREKMEFRVAKKRKEKREREIEIAGIMRSKQWTMDSFGKAATGKQGKRGNTQHGLSDSFLSGLHEKFSNNETLHPRKKKKRLERKRK